jgi:hypothetical protein
MGISYPSIALRFQVHHTTVIKAIGRHQLNLQAETAQLIEQVRENHAQNP